MVEDKIVFVGRLDEDTGLLEFLEWLDEQSRVYEVDFVGDGPLRKISEKYGKVHGFTKDVKHLLKKGVICVPAGYLSYIEAKHAGCKVKTFSNNALKKDYWNEIKKVKYFPTWEEVANLYLELWKK